MIQCKRIKYQVYGMQHLAYAPINIPDTEITQLIKSIAKTALVWKIEPVTTTINSFNQLHIDKVRTWLDDLKQFENE